MSEPVIHRQKTVTWDGVRWISSLCLNRPGDVRVATERDEVTCKRCLRMMAKDEREAGV